MADGDQISAASLTEDPLQTTRLQVANTLGRERINPDLQLEVCLPLHVDEISIAIERWWRGVGAIPRTCEEVGIAEQPARACRLVPSDQQVEFGRLIWGEARNYPQEIILADGAKPSGLFHLRIT